MLFRALDPAMNKLRSGRDVNYIKKCHIQRNDSHRDEIRIHNALLFDFCSDKQIMRYVCLDKSSRYVYESLILVDN